MATRTRLCTQIFGPVLVYVLKVGPISVTHTVYVEDTPSPWLTRIRFKQISLTRIFKKLPFLT